MTWHDADGDFHKRTVDTEDEAGRLRRQLRSSLRDSLSLVESELRDLDAAAIARALPHEFDDARAGIRSNRSSQLGERLRVAEAHQRLIRSSTRKPARNAPHSA